MVCPKTDETLMVRDRAGNVNLKVTGENRNENAAVDNLSLAE